MKHFYITVVIFIFIISVSVFSDRYIDKSVDEVTRKINNTENYEESVETKKLFLSKKNMLRLFVNKEHIDLIELNFILLENRYHENDFDKVPEIRIEIINGLDNIRNEITDFL